MIDISVKIKGEDSSYTKRLLEYDADVTMSRDDPTLKALVEEAMKEFKGHIEDVIVKTVMYW